MIAGIGLPVCASGRRISCMNARDLLPEIKSRLQEAYGERLRGVVLYGSQARGDARPDSDIDIMLLLDGPATTWDDIHKSSVALYDLMLENGIIIDVLPVDVHAYEEVDAPLYLDAKREGVVA